MDWEFLKIRLLLAVGLLMTPFEVSCYNILIIHPTPSISHQQPAMALTKALVERGHQVYVVSTNPVPGLENNYTYVDMSYMYTFFAKGKDAKQSHWQTQLTKWDFLDIFPHILSVPEFEFKSEAFQKFSRQVADENIQFDIVVGEMIYAPHICGITEYLAKGKPLVGLSTLNGDMFSEDALGSIAHASFYAFFDSYSDRLTIWQKLDSWYTMLYIEYKAKQLAWGMAEKFFKENYDQNYSVAVARDSCYGRISLTMLSSNSLYGYPRLLPPNVIELGPLHIKNPQKLAQNLQNWLDGAEKGVIYLSLGSNMQSKSLPNAVLANFLQFFKELPSGYRVLWKWEDNSKIPGQSSNILTQKWMPQQDVLAHPKVIAFITQGGLQSFQEAVHYGVPLIGIPWFGDQEFNVGKMVNAGIGTRITPQELHSFEAVKAAISTVLFDESYMKNMKRLSAVSRDFTSNAINKAVFWVEHVAKYGGADHLRPSTAGTTYFEYFCWDIISTILAISLVLIGGLVLVIKLTISTIRSKLEGKTKQS